MSDDAERSGTFNSQVENNPNFPVAFQHIVDQVAQVEALNQQSQSQAMAFIQENGAAVLDGHSFVNSPDSAFMSPMSNPAPEYPPGLNTQAIQIAYVGPATPQVVTLLQAPALPVPTPDVLVTLHQPDPVAPRETDAGID